MSELEIEKVKRLVNFAAAVAVDAGQQKLSNELDECVHVIEQLRQKLEAAESERDTYKEDLFKLRQKAENWSTKLGFVTSAINSRSIGVSEKERDFPHLLIERLHTESQLYKQKFERSESALREAREQKPYAYEYWFKDPDDETIVRITTTNEQAAIKRDHIPLFKSPVPAMPVQDDFNRAIDLAVTAIESCERISPSPSVIRIRLDEAVGSIIRLKQSEVKPS